MVGLACVDCTDCEMSLTEFLDDDFFAELEATIVLLGPRECIIPSGEGEVSEKEFYTFLVTNHLKVVVLIVVRSNQNSNGEEQCHGHHKEEDRFLHCI